MIVYLPMVKRGKSIPLGAATHPTYLADARHADLLIQYYSQITPENAGKYDYVYNCGWHAMDEIMAFGLPVHYHCLRWYWGIQPVNISDWITQAMTRYPSIVDWDVVNEGWDSYGNPTIGAIEESYSIARQVRPDARLWYNGILRYPAEQDHVKRLIEAGLCDAVGIQMHHDLREVCYLYEPFCKWLQDNHIPWRVSELDVLIPDYTPESLQKQAEAYRKAVQVCNNYGGLSVTMWGVADCVSWRMAYYPLPFDLEYNPKPAWNVFDKGE